MSIHLDGSTASVVRGDNVTGLDLSKDALLEIYQLILTHVSSDRDYTSVTSINKLLKIIELECEPDESEESAPPPVKKAPVRKAPAKKAPAKKPPPASESSDESSEESS